MPVCTWAGGTWVKGMRAFLIGLVWPCRGPDWFLSILPRVCSGAGNQDELLFILLLNRSRICEGLRDRDFTWVRRSDLIRDPLFWSWCAIGTGGRKLSRVWIASVVSRSLYLSLLFDLAGELSIGIIILANTIAVRFISSICSRCYSSVSKRL